ncbi:MAG: Holliday junction branch migration protein RuvA [Pseudomonadota bacterium]|jgi:Holliday junction DNA helicase RuvA
MISRLRGTYVEAEGDSIILDVHGVGYNITCTSALLQSLEPLREYTVCVHTDVREDAIRLFGFHSQAERQVFLLLNKVSGMGPRSSLDVLSNVSIRELLRAIGAGDVQGLMKIKGVGRKKAERIVVELKDLVGSMADERAAGLRVGGESGVTSGSAGQPVSSDAVAALEVLGFARRDAEIAVAKAAESGWAQGEVGDLVREALRFV